MIFACLVAGGWSLFAFRFPPYAFRFSLFAFRFPPFAFRFSLFAFRFKSKSVSAWRPSHFSLNGPILSG
jgi:hypothetical protein